MHAIYSAENLCAATFTTSSCYVQRHEVIFSGMTGAKAWMLSEIVECSLTFRFVLQDISSMVRRRVEHSYWYSDSIENCLVKALVKFLCRVGGEGCKITQIVDNKTTGKNENSLFSVKMFNGLSKN